MFVKHHFKLQIRLFGCKVTKNPGKRFVYVRIFVHTACFFHFLPKSGQEEFQNMQSEFQNMQKKRGDFQNMQKLFQN